MNTDALIACPYCDALYEIPQDPIKRIRCSRCHTVLISPRKGAGLKIIALAFISVALVVGALLTPFLTIERFWLSNEATLLDTILAFEGPLRLVAFGLLAVVIILPVARFLLTLYVLTPLVANRSVWPGAKGAFIWAERLKPWSMVEIFVLGCAVALFKIIDLANVELGPAFWMFVVLVIVMTVQNTYMCRWSVWKDLDR
ncbi:MAG: paraquat-inducible protein A [Silicimonas sp.]|nr:paraquat-inducible protein A [Silicimonas sp.]